MKSAICLSALVVLGILAITPISGYESLYGRTFSLFNLLQSPQTQVKSLLQRYAAFDASFNFITSQFSSLQSQITSLASQITALTTAVNALSQPRCPASVAATGKLIGNKCFTLGTIPKTFPDAAADCSSQGGKLVEPSPTTQANGLALYNSIKNAFGSTFTTSVTASSNLWIGIQRAATLVPFSFLSTGLALAVTDPTTIFDTTGGSGEPVPDAAGDNAPEGATLKPTGKYINELQSDTITRNYICQFNAF